jgi:hypothetical protein
VKSEGLWDNECGAGKIISDSSSNNTIADIIIMRLQSVLLPSISSTVGKFPPPPPPKRFDLKQT